MSTQNLTWRTAYKDEEEEELYGWDTEDLGMSSLFGLTISSFKKCSSSEGPKGSSWMWSCSMPARSKQQPGSEGDHL